MFVKGSNSEIDKRSLIAVDLFSGGGGLSYGLRQAGFVVSAAVEMDREACNTYAKNHPNTILFEDDIRTVAGRQLQKTSPTGVIDLVAACPPCQGFSALTSKYGREDPRNQLVFEVERIISELEPKVFMIENVPGLASKGKGLLRKAMDSLSAIGYNINYDVLEVADYGVPQRRKRLVILGSKVGQLPLPARTHTRDGSNGTAPWVTFKDALYPNSRGKPKEISQFTKGEDPRDANWHVTRKLSAINRERLRATKQGLTRASIPMELRPECHKHSNSGYSNVYGRMSMDQPAPTITGGCVTLSKGRFGHPTLLRTISVREAAILQSFPEEYIFDSPYIDYVCGIIGNALPPLFAEKIARHCFYHIQNSHE
jgi:DNA (cytosine-5)-methyltransferase 1